MKKMIIKCTKCHTAFKIEDKLIKETGTSFRCSQCRQVFRIYPAKADQKKGEASHQTSEPNFIRRGKTSEALNDVYHLLNNFEYALKQVLESTQKLLDDYENRKPEIREKKTKEHHEPASEKSELFMELDRLLKNNDLEAEDSLNRLKFQLTDSEVQNDLNRLEAYINHLEFENARKTLKKIAQALNIS